MQKTSQEHKNNCDSSDANDPYNLSRFMSAQQGIYDQALKELKNGRKRSHWMWYIFPQIDGLGYSPTARFYAIKSIEEADQYLSHSVLGTRLVECSKAILHHTGLNVSQIFGSPDDMKLRSSMTLFEVAGNSRPVFGLVLDTFFAGQRDDKTLSILEKIQADYHKKP